ncbi:glycosyltransferase [Halomonas sp. V046]|uniref:glycosyltransferase n=1 Tax=Halomonas sp. V046 TaxID=3459611 RepID=UPI00404397B0
MNVLFVIDHLDSGGAPIVARDLILGMHHAGAKITLIILSDRQRYELPEEVNVIRLPHVARGRIRRWRRYRDHAELLDRTLASLSASFDLVLAHLHHAHQVVSRSKVSETAWYCLHADPVTGFLGNKRGLGRWRKRRKVRKLYDQRRIVTVSQGMLERLQLRFSITPKTAVAIHNPLDLDRIRDLAGADVDDVPRDFLLFVGRMDQRQKRFDRLFAAYRDSDADIPLVLVGDGSGQAGVAALAKSMGVGQQVRMLGARDNPFAYMKRARALLLSSDYEGFALVIAEALAVGTPVVTVDCPSGPAEIMGDFYPEGLVAMDDNDAFASAIRKVVERPPLVADDICDRFRLEFVTQRYLDLGDVG